MSNVGWIKLHRKILNWEWYKDSNVCRVYIHFLLTAVYEDTKWKGKSLKKGDCIFSIAEMSKQLDLTRQQLRTVNDVYVPSEFYLNNPYMLPGQDTVYAPFMGDYDFMPYGETFGYKVEHICQTSFLVQSGFITGWKWKGNDCFAN